MNKPYAEWTEERKKKNRAYSRAWNKANPEKYRANKRTYLAKHPDIQRAYYKSWIDTHLENNRLSSRTWYRNNSTKAGASINSWFKIHPEQRKAYGHNRRVRLVGNGGSFTGSEWKELKAQFSYTCPCCNSREPEIRLVPDHMIPVARGGSSNIENVQPLCVKCNSEKHTKILSFNPFNN